MDGWPEWFKTWLTAAGWRAWESCEEFIWTHPFDGSQRFVLIWDSQEQRYALVERKGEAEVSVRHMKTAEDVVAAFASQRP